MTGHSNSISKKKKQSGKEAQSKATRAALSSQVAASVEKELDVSPVSIKSGGPGEQGRETKQVVSVPSSARRTLNFSSPNLCLLTSSFETASTLGALKKATSESLKQKSRGIIDVNLRVSPIRLPDTWSKFQFFLLADHTGVASLGASVEIFKVLEPFQSSSNPLPPVKFQGKVHYKWSTKTKGEVYMSVREGEANVSLTTPAENPQAFSTFHTIRHIISNPYYSNSCFSHLIGDCVLSQSDGEGKHSFMLQDATGFAVVHVLGESSKESELPQNLEKGPKRFTGLFKFGEVEIDDITEISTTIHADKMEMKNAHPLIERHINLVKNTKPEDYQFPFEDEFDVRSS